MLSGPLLINIIKYTIPIILTGILQLLFNAADLVVVGRFCGSVSVGAVGATSSLIHLIVNLFIGVSLGAGVCTAHAIGARDDKILSKTVHTAIPTAIICGIIVTAIGFFASGSILRLMDTPKNYLALSTTYTKIYFLGAVALMVYNFGAAILRAAGDSRSPLIFLTLSGVLNVVLNVIFVILFHLDVAGVALATTISQYLSAILVVIALMRRSDAAKLTIKGIRISHRIIAKIIKIGLPAGLQSCMFSFSNIIIQSSLNSFGEIAVSGCSAAANIEGFSYTAMNSFHQTALNFTGQNAGAGNYKRSKKVLIYCLICVTACGLFLGVITYIFGKPLLSIYITDSSEAISYGFIRLTYICLPYFICGIMDVTTGAIRGLGVSTGPMLISILGVVGVRLLWIFTIFADPRWHSLESLYLSYTISWALTFLAQLILYIILYKRRTASAPLENRGALPVLK